MKFCLSFNYDEQKAKRLARTMPAERAAQLAANEIFFHIQRDDRSKAKAKGKPMPSDAVRTIKRTMRDYNVSLPAAIEMLMTVNFMREGAYPTAEEYEKKLADIEARYQTSIDRTRIQPFIPDAKPTPEAEVRKQLKKLKRETIRKPVSKKPAPKSKKLAPKAKKPTSAKQVKMV